MKTKVILVESKKLTITQKETMWLLYKKSYHYSREYFMERFHKNTHFSLYVNQKEIVGFTGLRINKIHLSDECHLLMYFGQTYIEKAFRGKSLIPTTGVKLMRKYWKDFLSCKVWCWYDALTYKAYLVSAKTVPEFYPTYRLSTPSKTQTLMNHIGKMYYGNNYCLKNGTVNKPTNNINDKSVFVSQKDLDDKDVQFFASANPGHKRGNGLLTFTPLNRKNAWALILRYLKNQVGKINKPKKKKNQNLRNQKSPQWLLRNNEKTVFQVI